MRVMVSSTLNDLETIRADLTAFLERSASVKPCVCEYWTARPGTTLENSLLEAGRCDLLICLIGARYGTCPKGKDKSYTELEFDVAVSRKIPILVFIQNIDPEELTEESLEQWNFRNEFIERIHALELITTKSFTRTYDIMTELALALPVELGNMERSSLRERDDQLPCFAHDYTLLNTDLFGRAAEHSQLNEWAQDSEHPIAVIEDIGGMGKSALAHDWWLKQFVDESDGRQWDGGFWYSFYEPETNFRDVLCRLCSYVAGTPVTKYAQKTMQDLQREAETILKDYKLILVLDGFEAALRAYNFLRADLEKPKNPAQDKSEKRRDAGPGTMKDADAAPQQQRAVRDRLMGAFLAKLSKQGLISSKILLTTRMFPSDLEAPKTQSKLPGVRHWHLGGLDLQACRDYWEASGLNRDDPQLPEFVRLIEGYPLALSIMAGAMVAARMPTLSEFQTFDPDFSVFDPEFTRDRARSDVFGAGFRGLDDDSRAILATIANFRSPAHVDLLEQIHTGARRSVDEMLTFSGADETAVQPDEDDDGDAEHREAMLARLKRLEDLNFLGWSLREQSYEMHPVIRGLVKQRIRPEEFDKAAKDLLNELQMVPGRTTIHSISDLKIPIQIIYSMLDLGRYEEAAYYYVDEVRDELKRFDAKHVTGDMLGGFFKIESGSPAPIVKFQWDGDPGTGRVARTEFANKVSDNYEDVGNWEMSRAFWEVHQSAGVCRDPMCETSTLENFLAGGFFRQADLIFRACRKDLRRFSRKQAKLPDDTIAFMQSRGNYEEDHTEDNYRRVLSYGEMRLANCHFDRSIEVSNAKLARLAFVRRERIVELDGLDDGSSWDSARSYARARNLDLAKVARLEDRADLGLKISHAVFADAQEDNHLSDRRSALVSMSADYLDLNDFRRAEEALLKYFDISHDISETRRSAHAWRNLAKARIAMRKFDEAETGLDELLIRTEQWSDVLERVRVLLITSSLHSERNEHDKAIEALEQVIHYLCRDPGTPANEPELTEAIGKLSTYGAWNKGRQAALLLGEPRIDRKRDINPVDRYYTWSGGAGLELAPDFSEPRIRTGAIERAPFVSKFLRWLGFG